MSGIVPTVSVTFTLSPRDYADGFDCDPQRLADGIRARLDEFYGDDAHPRFPRDLAVKVTAVQPTPLAPLRLDTDRMRVGSEWDTEPPGRLGLSRGALMRVAARLGLPERIALVLCEVEGIPVNTACLRH